MNKAILIGHVGAEPQFKTAGKTDICNFRIAVNDKFKKDAPPQWFTITSFGKTATFVRDYMKKGQKVLVEGKIQMDEVEKDGVKRLFVSIISDSIELLSSTDKVKSEQPEDTGLPF
jgi:single-strand DNA-binding protein